MQVHQCKKDTFTKYIYLNTRNFQLETEGWSSKYILKYPAVQNSLEKRDVFSFQKLYCQNEKWHVEGQRAQHWHAELHPSV